MYISRNARWGAVAVIGIVLLGGCKKESQQVTEVPPQSPMAQQSAPSAPGQAATGEELFKQHCMVCHPDGGNIVKPDYTLHAKALKSHNIGKPEDIVRIMRSPGAGMTTFDEATIPDKEALAIAEYILKTFK